MLCVLLAMANMREDVFYWLHSRGLLQRIQAHFPTRTFSHAAAKVMLCPLPNH